MPTTAILDPLHYLAYAQQIAQARLTLHNHFLDKFAELAHDNWIARLSLGTSSILAYNSSNQRKPLPRQIKQLAQEYRDTFASLSHPDSHELLGEWTDSNGWSLTSPPPHAIVITDPA